MSRFTPDRLRAEADAVEEDLHIRRSVGRMLAAMLRQAAEDAEEVSRLRSMWDSHVEHVATTLRHLGCEPRDGRSFLDGKRPEAQHLSMVLSALTAERDEARTIAQRWHETVREMDGEFYSLKSQALHELLADAATIAGWSKDNAPAVAKPSTEGAE